jgi:hypothetical protein
MTPDTKPRCKLTRTDGNVFALLARVRTTLTKAGREKDAEEVTRRLAACQSYDEALRLFMEYVHIH